MKVVEGTKKGKQIVFGNVPRGSTFRAIPDGQILIKIDTARISTGHACCLETGQLHYLTTNTPVYPVTCEVHVLPEESSRTISIGDWASTEPRGKFT